LVYRRDDVGAVCSHRFHDLDREESQMTTFNLPISNHMIALGSVFAALASACFLLARLPR
jgi:hypothetical protein